MGTEEAAAKVETARAALVELEERLAAGLPVGREERRQVNADYQAAEAELAELERTEAAEAAQALTLEPLESTTELGTP